MTGYGLFIDESEVRFEAVANPATCLIGNWRPFPGDTVAAACSCRLALSTATSLIVWITCREILPVAVLCVCVCVLCVCVCVCVFLCVFVCVCMCVFD